MTTRFRIEPEASAELEEAALWYERQRQGLGGEFLETVDEAREFIARFPGAGTPVPDVAPELPVRRVPVKRFPFHVVYLASADVIHLLAFAHDSRLPGYWHSRLRKQALRRQPDGGELQLRARPTKPGWRGGCVCSLP